MFLHRHYLELGLKEIIIYLSDLNGEKITTPKGNHDIMNLWHQLKSQLEIFQKNSYVRPPKSIENKIKEFHNLDKASDEFRYPVDKKGAKNLMFLEIINYRNFKDEFSEVKEFIDGISDMLLVARDDIGFVRNVIKKVKEKKS